jgi:prolipoprotein diacylglyceryltransferase
MLPYINIFGAAIAFSPLIILIGIWLGTSLAEKHAPKHNLSPEVLYNLIFIGLVAFVLGGRLGYAAQNPSAFAEDPLSLFSRNFGLFEPISGAVVGLIAVVIYGQRKQLDLWQTLDALTPALAVFMIAIPLANLASGNAFGAPSSLPWAIRLWGEFRHPVQIYEIIGAAVILWAIFPGIHKPTRKGMNFLTFTACTALARLFFEGFRGSSPVTILGLRTAQLAAWAILALALWQIYQIRRTQQT